jgi:hypothetical protein
MNIYTTSKEDTESLYFPIDAPIREELKEEGCVLRGWGGDTMSGKKHPEITKRRISEAKIGKKLSAAHCKAMSKSMSGKKNPMYGTKRPAHAQRMNKRVKINNTIYNSMSDAAVAHGVSCSLLTKWKKIGKAVLI